MMGAAGAMLGFIGDQYTNGQNQQFASAQGKKQYQRQRALNQQGKDLAKQMWDETNYEAQMKHMMNAGLNPNTIYGGSGAGGATASTGSGGSAPSVQATSQSGGFQAGLGQMSQMGMMKTQQELMEAQKENVEANTNKTNVEASNIEEPITAGVSKTLAERDKTKADTQGQEIENEVTGETREEEKQRLRAEANKATGQATQEMVQGDIANQTRADQINTIKAQAVGASLENALTEMKTKVSAQELQVMKQTIRKMQADISQGWEKLNQSEREVQIKKLEQELKAIYPQLGQVWGGKINEALRDIDDELGQGGGNYHGKPTTIRKR